MRATFENTEFNNLLERIEAKIKERENTISEMEQQVESLDEIIPQLKNKMNFRLCTAKGEKTCTVFMYN